MVSSTVSWIGGILLVAFVLAVLLYLIWPSSMRSALITSCICCRRRPRKQSLPDDDSQKITMIDHERDLEKQDLEKKDLERQDTDSSDWSDGTLHDVDIKTPPPAAVAEPKAGPASRPWI